MFKKTNYIVLGFLFLVLSCNNKKNVENNLEKQSGGGGGFVLPAQVKNIFATKCAPCHTSPGGANPYWLDYATVYSKKDRIKARALDVVDPNNPMPPPGMPSLSVDEKKILSDWIAAGAPGEKVDDSKPTAPTEPPVTPPVTPPADPAKQLPADIKAVFETKCSPCHTSQGGGLPYWLDYAQVFAKKDLIKKRALDPIPADGSVLPMPPPGMSELTAEQKTLLLDWIKAGAPPAEGGAQPPPTQPAPPSNPPAPPAPPVNPIPDLPSKINFQEHIKPRVVMIYCSACHNETSEQGNPKMKDWSKYDKVFANRDLVQTRVFVETDPSLRMPLGSTLPAYEFELLKAWLKNGAPEW